MGDGRWVTGVKERQKEQKRRVEEERERKRKRKKRREGFESKACATSFTGMREKGEKGGRGKRGERETQSNSATNPQSSRLQIHQILNSSNPRSFTPLNPSNFQCIPFSKRPIMLQPCL